MTNCSLSPPVTPLLFTTVTTSFHPPNPFSFPLPLSLIWKSPTTTTTNWKRIHYIGTSLTPWFSFYFILFFLPWSTSPSSFFPPILTFLFILLCYSNPSPLFILFVPHASPSSMVLWPSCGPRCLWPADMSRLHSTVLHSAPSLFPCPLFPLPFLAPCPAAPSCCL